MSALPLFEQRSCEFRSSHVIDFIEKLFFKVTVFQIILQLFIYIILFMVINLYWLESIFDTNSTMSNLYDKQTSIDKFLIKHRKV
jgi:hypothetical protein